jgi:hypothetical protein
MAGRYRGSGARDHHTRAGAEAQSYRARRKYLAARYNDLLTMMQLKQLTGTISADDIAFVNSLLDPRRRSIRRIPL